MTLAEVKDVAAHIPESLHFQTKPALAIPMLKRIEEAGNPIAWVVTDTALRWQPEYAEQVGGACISLCGGRGLQ